MASIAANDNSNGEQRLHGWSRRRLKIIREAPDHERLGFALRFEKQSNLIVIARISEGSAAWASGVRDGMVLVAINDEVCYIHISSLVVLFSVIFTSETLD